MRIARLLSICAPCLVLLGAGVAAQNVVVNGASTNMAEEQAALKQARAQAIDASARSRKLEALAAAAGQEADRARNRLAALAARIQQSEAEIRAGEARIAILNQLQAAQAVLLAEKREPAVRLIAALQNVARRPSVFALLQPGSLRDAVHVRAVLATAIPVIDRRTAGLRAQLDKSLQLRLMAETAQQAMQQSRVQLAGQQRDLRRLEAERRLAARGLTSNASLEADRATAMGEKARDILDLMARLEDAGQTRERLAELPGPQLRPDLPGAIPAPITNRTASAASGPGAPAYRLPVIGSLVTGMGELSGSGVRARGLTIATGPSAQIIAPAGGHVAFAGPYRGFGLIAIIDHGQGWTSLLANLSRLSVATGQTLAQGDPVGLAGTDHPKVTVELRRNGRPIDIVALMQSG